MSNLRKCKKCGIEQDILNFPINNTLASGILRKHTCNTCRARQSSARQKLHKTHKKPFIHKCPICLRYIESKNLVMDHNHTNDKFRGWLCNDCNNALGKFNDNIDNLKRAIDYLSLDN